MQVGWKRPWNLLRPSSQLQITPQWDVDAFQDGGALSTKERSVPRSSVCQNPRSKATARHEATFPIRNTNLTQRHVSANLALSPSCPELSVAGKTVVIAGAVGLFFAARSANMKRTRPLTQPKGQWHRP